MKIELHEVAVKDVYNGYNDYGEDNGVVGYNGKYQHATFKQKLARKQNRKRNEEFLKQHKHFEDAWAEVCLECCKDGEEPSYDDFKMLIDQFESDFDGNKYSLYKYVMR